MNAYGVVIIGGGPAGLAPLLAAHRRGRLEALLDRGVLVLDRSRAIGAGQLGDYGINSDSTGTTFVDCLNSPVETALTALQSHPIARQVAAAKERSVPLPLAGEFMALVGARLCEMVQAHPRCRVLGGYNVLSTRRRPTGEWLTTALASDGEEQHFRSSFVVIATGAEQPLDRLAQEHAGGIVIADRCKGKLMQSGEALAVGGMSRIAARLRGVNEPKVVVIGGSTSAVAVTHALLNRLDGVVFGRAALTLAHRRELRVFYPTAEAALAEGYTEFDVNDICPVSKRVFRLAGFRLDSRELVMQARGIGGRPPEPRLQLHRLQDHDPEFGALLDSADLVITAFGYRPRATTVYDIDGAPIELLARQSSQAPLVDRSCRVLDAAGTPVPGLFGIGLAAGFVPSGPLGGEPSFSGQANGLWLWQNDVGLIIVDAVTGEQSSPTYGAEDTLPRAVVLHGAAASRYE